MNIRFYTNNTYARIKSTYEKYELRGIRYIDWRPRNEVVPVSQALHPNNGLLGHHSMETVQ